MMMIIIMIFPYLIGWCVGQGEMRPDWVAP